MKYLLFLFGIALCVIGMSPGVWADDINYGNMNIYNDSINYSNMDLYNVSGATIVGGNNVKSLSPFCQSEVDAFFGQSLSSLIDDNIKDSLASIVVLLFVIVVLWLFEPVFKKLVDKERYKYSYIFLYKWVSVGLIIVCVIGLLILRGSIG